jgi:hypothetical protein
MGSTGGAKKKYSHSNFDKILFSRLFFFAFFSKKKVTKIWASINAGMLFTMIMVTNGSLVYNREGRLGDELIYGG